MNTLSYKNLLLLLVSTTSFFYGCSDIYNYTNSDCITGEGSTESRTLQVNNFSALELLLPADVTIKQGNAHEVIVTGNTNILDIIETTVTGNALEIESSVSCLNNVNLALEITLPTLQSVTIDGSGDVVIQDFNNQSNFKGSISGSGKIEMNQFEGAEDMRFAIDGSGIITANDDIRSLENLSVDINGSGRYNGYAIESRNASIDISGSGRCNLSVEETLSINIDGSGNISYHGSPSINQNISGSGNISKAK